MLNPVIWATIVSSEWKMQFAESAKPLLSRRSTVGTRVEDFWLEPWKRPIFSTIDGNEHFGVSATRLQCDGKSEMQVWVVWQFLDF